MSCKGVISASLPEGLTSIDDSLFSGCSSLTSISFGSQVTKIDDYAFSGCSSLTEIVLPERLTDIGKQVFARCSSLETVVIPGTVSKIGSDVFSGCDSLRKIVYCGTEAQWHKISVHSSNTILKTIEIQYHVPVGGSCTTAPTCSICGDVAGEPLDHSGAWMEIVPTTCEQSGIQARICDMCGITETQNIEALGHQGVWQQMKEPTCVESGITTRVCSVCNTTETVTLPALGHSNESKVVAPTCTEQGYTSYACAVCGVEEKTDYTPATGHGWSEWIQTVPPGCNTEGSRVRFCNCGSKETETLAMLMHKYVDGACICCGTVMCGYVVLSTDVNLSGLSLSENLYIDLNGFDLSGVIILNGYKVYAMDSTTNEYTDENIGYFSCTDENGNAIVPQSLYTAVDAKRYMAIETENGYTFHRFYFGITKLSLVPSVVGFGYKAEFYGDDMVQTQIKSVGYNLWLTEDWVIEHSAAFKNTLTLRLMNFDVENYGETPVNACACITLKDGTVIESAVVSYSLRQMVEYVNASHTDVDIAKLDMVRDMIAEYTVMQRWLVENIFKKSQ